MTKQSSIFFEAFGRREIKRLEDKYGRADVQAIAAEVLTEEIERLLKKEIKHLLKNNRKSPDDQKRKPRRG